MPPSPGRGGGVSSLFRDQSRHSCIGKSQSNPATNKERNGSRTPSRQHGRESLRERVVDEAREGLGHAAELPQLRRSQPASAASGMMRSVFCQFGGAEPTAARAGCCCCDAHLPRIWARTSATSSSASVHEAWALWRCAAWRRRRLSVPCTGTPPTTTTG
eukprot:COSAG01_NODE_64_length_29509_cov_1035.985209_4_plen_160_part_00